MATTRDANWTVRMATFALWAAAAASAVYWGLKVGAGARGTAAPPVVARQPAPDAVAIARLLGQGAPGATVAAAPTAARYQLVGVVSDASRQGAALIAVEGRAAKPFRVGAVVDEGIVLQSVAPRRAVLAKADTGAEVATLDMPAPGGAQR